MTAFSIILVILESIISGFAPSREVVTDRMGNSTIGNLSIPIFWKPIIPNSTKIPDIIQAKTCLRIEISGSVIIYFCVILILASSVR